MEVTCILYREKNKRVKKLTVAALENVSKAIFVSQRLLQQAKELGYFGKNAVIIPSVMFNVLNDHFTERWLILLVVTDF